jgi:hypothetical protein
MLPTPAWTGASVKIPVRRPVTSPAELLGEISYRNKKARRRRYQPERIAIALGVHYATVRQRLCHRLRVFSFSQTINAGDTGQHYGAFTRRTPASGMPS